MLTFYDEEILQKERRAYVSGNSGSLSSGQHFGLVLLVNKLIQAADESLQEGPWSVVGKLPLPPSNNGEDNISCNFVAHFVTSYSFAAYTNLAFVFSLIWQV